MDSRHGKRHGGNNASIGEANDNNDVCVGSPKRGRLQRHRKCSGDRKSEAKCRKRHDVGLLKWNCAIKCSTISNARRRYLVGIDG